MSNIIGLKEFRENTENYINDLKKGKSFVVVRKSKPVFKLSPVDVWGDDGMWEKVIDFKKIQKDGVELSEIIKSLKRIS
jgi:antitoxin (DNA-binding transcriptional repressor) of toxin-antitoxin stability system